MDAEAEDHRPDLTPHPLAPEPEDFDGLPDRAVSVIVGYVGRARDDAHVRIYLGSFSAYYELLTADVVSTSSVDASYEASPTSVYVRASAEVSFVQLSRLSGSASFVSGAIRSRYGRGVRAGGYVAEIYEPSHCHPVTHILFCATEVYCESVDYCESATIICPAE